MPRCQVKLFSTGLVCKNKSKFLICNKRFCWVHASKKFSSMAIYIQKIWRGYRNRIIIKNVYNRLPDDLQRLVSFYVNTEIYNNRRNKQINNILTNRWLNFSKIYREDKSQYNIMLNPFETIKEISHNFYLFNKYFEVWTSALEYNLLEHNNNWPDGRIAWWVLLKYNQDFKNQVDILEENYIADSSAPPLDFTELRRLFNIMSFNIISLYNNMAEHRKEYNRMIRHLD